MDWLAEWFAAHGWAAWGVLGIVLAAAELLTLDLTLLMLASGALAAAGVWFLAPSLVWLQLAAAIVVSVLTLWLLRPTLLARVRNAPGYRSALDQIVGSGGVATAAISRNAGEVRVDGQLWEARPFDSDLKIEAGESVEVYGIDGVTLLVHPVPPHQLPGSA